MKSADENSQYPTNQITLKKSSPNPHSSSCQQNTRGTFPAPSENPKSGFFLSIAKGNFSFQQKIYFYSLVCPIIVGYSFASSLLKGKMSATS